MIPEAEGKDLEVADVVDILEQLLEHAPRLRVRQRLAAQLLERLGQSGREAIEEFSPVGRLGRIPELVEGLAFEVAELLELVPQFGERLAQVHLAVPA